MFGMPKLLIFVLLLTACIPQANADSHPDIGNNNSPWASALRVIDLADSPTPAYDITAVYLRQAEDALQIRIDLLDFKNPNDIYLDIRIADGAALQESALIIHIPTQSIAIRFSLDPELATVIVEIPLSQIPTQFTLDVTTPEDEIKGLTLDGPYPAQTAPLLLTFYDTFGARTPAEALRSWDGAHTGPRGERHGLKHLLEAVEKYQVPVVLLDLKEPENLSALDAMGVLAHIQHLQASDLLVLPDQSEEEPIFGFPTSPFSWGGNSRWGTLSPQLTFAFSSEPTHFYQPILSKTTIIPVVKETQTTEPTPGGPSLDVRRQLLETALNLDEKDILVLGGSLRHTTWGSPDMVGATMAYFASRPYIHILTADDLIRFPSKYGKPKLQSPPIDGFAESLEMHYQNMTQPVLEFAENWDGAHLSSCGNDIDKDQLPECILANDQYLAILDPQGARLVYLFSVKRDRFSGYRHQLIGPSWQVAVGLSNPALWDISAGEAADPGAYPGAFADLDDPFRPYEPRIEGESLVFTSLDGTRTKTFKITNIGLEVVYATQETVRTQIPLLVDPWMRFTPGWAENYVYEITPNGIRWGLGNSLMVDLHAEGVVLSLAKGPVTMRAFNESLSLLSSPEDPDFNYPPGFRVPFPMAIVEASLEDGYHLRIELR